MFDVTLVDDKDNVVADFTKQNIKSKYKLSLDGESIKEIIKKHVSRSIVEEVGKDQVMRDFRKVCPEYFRLSSSAEYFNDSATNLLIWDMINMTSRDFSVAASTYEASLNSSSSSGVYHFDPGCGGGQRRKA